MMRLLITAAICLVAAASEQPGCEKAKEFKKMNVRTCCKTFPQMTNHDHMKECGAPCKTFGSHFEKRCCWVNCTLAIDNLLNSEGAIDTEAMTKYLEEKTKSEDWEPVIKSSIETCVKEAPEFLKKLKETKHEIEKCQAAETLAMKHCITRELYFNCPKKVTSKQCTEYEEFGKECLSFPMMHSVHKKKKQEEEEEDE